MIELFSEARYAGTGHIEGRVPCPHFVNLDHPLSSKRREAGLLQHFSRG